MATYERKVKRLLRQAGWAKVRQGRSGHEQWQHPGNPGYTITVPSKITSKHTANGVLGQAGLDERV